MKLITSEDFESHTLTWAELGHILRRRRQIILFVFLGMLLATYISLQLTTEYYQSEASLLVKLGRENTEMPASVQNGTLVSTGVRKEELNSEVRLLSSRVLLERVVDKIGPDAFAFRPARPHGVFQAIRYGVRMTVRWFKQQAQNLLIVLNLKKELTLRERAILALEDALTVDADKDSDVIALQLRLPSAELGQNALNVLLQVYMEEHIRARRNPQIREFFDQELESKRGQLKELEKARDQVRERWKLSSADEQRSLLLKRLSDIHAQIDANQSEISGLEKQQQAMASSLSAVPDSLRTSEVTTQNPTIQSIKERITSLQLERAKLASRYTDDAEPLKKIDEEIASVQSQLTQEQPTIVASSTSEITPVKKEFSQKLVQDQVDIAALQARDQQLNVPAAAIDSQLRQIDNGEEQLRTAERELKLAEQDYLTYAQRREEAYISEELDLNRIANVSVLSPPSLGFEPVSPRKALIMGLALILGLIIAVGVALLLEYLDDAVHSSGDVEKIAGLRWLGTISISEAREKTA